MTKQEQIKKNILQVMSCGGEVELKPKKGVVNELWTNETFTSFGIQGDRIITINNRAVTKINKFGITTFKWGDIIPILHRLSSLTKEITVEGETFIPKERLQDYWTEFPKGAFEARDVEFWYSGIIDQLHAWQFFTGDQSLFDSGEIIDKLKID